MVVTETDSVTDENFWEMMERGEGCAVLAQHAFALSDPVDELGSDGAARQQSQEPVVNVLTSTEGEAQTEIRSPHQTRRVSDTQ